MLKEKILSQSVRLICASGIMAGLSLTGQVYAQQAEQPTQPQQTTAKAAEEPIQKVEVTGTRIPVINTDTSSPITVVTAKDIQISGATKAEDFLNNLPQVFAGQGSATSNGATGTATVDLRGLGPNRTLMLVNGRRMPYGSTGSAAPDLNEIPAGLIQRVEVLTGGAGAVYGAGAVAGVVNFILKDDFQGVEMSVNQSGYNHRQQQSAVSAAAAASGYDVPGNIGYDGKISNASILLGSNFDGNKGNATAYFSFERTDAVLQSARDYSACPLGPTV